LLLGGVHYLDAVSHSGGEGVAPATYGEWHNLLHFPAAIFLAPYSSSDTDFVLPWTRIPTPWYRYDVYASHYGQLVTIALLLLPWFFRKNGAATERRIVFIIGVAFFLLMMPIQAVPAGFAPYFPRYLLTTAVLILCATIAPLFAAIERR